MSVTDGSSIATLPSAGPARTDAPQALTPLSTDLTTRATIGGRLDDLERRFGVRVLYAVETGSRAWGFASIDSDYDVRYVFVRPLADYLRLDKVKDPLEAEPDPVLDLAGWDLPKALRLARISNPSLTEWLGSPTVYRTSDDWESLRPLLRRCYQPWPTRHHYLGMALKNWSTRARFGAAMPKRYLYVIRPLLACRWIAANDVPAPVPLAQLADATLEPEMRGRLDDLIATKVCSSPALGPGELPEWDAWIVREFAVQQAYVRAEPVPEGPGWDELNAAFRRILGLAG